MLHYVAIVEDAGPESAVGSVVSGFARLLFGGDTLDEAMRNAAEAVTAYAEALEQDGHRLPAPRLLSTLKADPDFVADARDHMVALIEVPERVATAAE